MQLQPFSAKAPGPPSLVGQLTSLVMHVDPTPATKAQPTQIVHASKKRSEEEEKQPMMQILHGSPVHCSTFGTNMLLPPPPPLSHPNKPDTARQTVTGQDDKQQKTRPANANRTRQREKRAYRLGRPRKRNPERLHQDQCNPALPANPNRQEEDPCSFSHDCFSC
ncbi:hypothetical protein CCMA1212_006378 [Trichoderma ghanense]|uniref:BZIP domain-containing protein n=1 Tax=Trichoderma ghanense TaxID=65468 RepID=A0ABY2H0B1_9HYPO